MAKVSKRRKAANAKVEEDKLYSLQEAVALVKEVNTAHKFDASVDIHIRLGVDPRKADQALRGTVSLPHGTGKTKRVLVFCTPDKEEEAKAAGADYAGLDELIKKVQDIAKENSIDIQQGSYAGLSGPTLETPAEYNYVRAIGADTVGMSTVPEVIAARHMGIPCVGFSIITDLGIPGKIIEMTHEIVQEVANKAEPKMTIITKELISLL